MLPAAVVGHQVLIFRSEEYTMDNNFLQFVRPTDAVPMLSILLAPVILLGPFVAHYWYKLRVKQWEMSLKHTMLEKGMSAEEIKMVLEASTPGGEKKHGCGRGWC